jgi:uncharacterized protein
LATIASVIESPAVTASPQRVRSLDILRGFALLGMILVHVHMNLERPGAGWEDLISWFIWVGVEQKSWATFAFLFGVGFAIQLQRMQARGAPVTSLYLRRLLGLALFGVLAYTLFGFRILLDYAFWGVPLLFIRRWSTRALLLTALISVSALSLVKIVGGVHEWMTLGKPAADALTEARDATPNPVWAELKEVQAQPSYAMLVRARVRAMGADYLRWSFFLTGTNLALFILGFLALRNGLFEAPQKHVRLILVAMLLGLLSWATWWLVLRELHTELVPQRIATELRNGLGIVREQWLAFTYIGGLVLLLAYRPAFERRLAWLGLAGRMALTNYLIQIAILDMLSSGYGAALRVRPLLDPVLTAVIFGLEIGATRWWLARYRLGPAEWLWRSFTYGNWQPLRKVDSRAVA